MVFTWSPDFTAQISPELEGGGGRPSPLDEIAQQHAALVEIRQEDDLSALLIGIS